jgi:hypothetical protein
MSMPYVITTTAGTGDGYPCNTPSGFAEIRRAVATLDEALEYAHSLVPDDEHFDHNNRHAAIDSLGNHGGTVGPLPDGTTIQVEKVGWLDLSRSARIPDGWADHGEPTELRQRSIIDAYNAAQEVSA